MSNTRKDRIQDRVRYEETIEGIGEGEGEGERWFPVDRGCVIHILEMEWKGWYPV